MVVGREMDVEGRKFYCIFNAQFTLHMKKISLLSMMLLTLAGSGFAQRPGGGEGGGRGDGAKPAATIASVTQNLKKYEGFYPFYYDDKTGKIYLEIDRWGMEFLYFTSLPEGVGNGGAERGGGNA